MIVTYFATKARHVRGTRVEVGQALYAVRKAGWYFIWSYSDRAFAEAMDAKISLPPTGTGDFQANWRKSTAELTPSDRKSFD